MDRCTAGTGARDGRHRRRGHSVGPHTSASPFRPDWHSALSSANPSLALDPAECKNGVGAPGVPGRQRPPDTSAVGTGTGPLAVVDSQGRRAAMAAQTRSTSDGDRRMSRHITRA